MKYLDLFEVNNLIFISIVFFFFFNMGLSEDTDYEQPLPHMVFLCQLQDSDFFRWMQHCVETRGLAGSYLISLGNNMQCLDAM